MFLRGHYDDSLMNPPKKMVLTSKKSPSLLSFLFLFSVPLGCDKSCEVATRSRTDRVTQPWTSRLPNCEAPATPTPMGSRLGPEALDRCPPWSLLLEDMLWFSLPSLVLAAYGASVSYLLLGCCFQASAFLKAVHHSGFKNRWLKDSL